MKNSDRYPYLSIHPHFMSSYTESLSFIRGHRSEFMKPPPQQNKHHGIVSIKAASKIKKAVYWLHELANKKHLPGTRHKATVLFKSAFITLTLPSTQVHDDKFLQKELLEKFLDYLRKNCRVKNYIWRTEVQANGNLHWHIIIDKYIHHSSIRAKWISLLKPLSYIDEYAKNNPLLFSKDEKDFSSVNPPCTEIKSVQNKGQLARYCSKEMSKPTTYKSAQLQEIRRAVECRLWGCNVFLSKIKGACEMLIFEVADEYKKLCEMFKERVFTQDFFEVIAVRTDQWWNQGFVFLETIYLNHMMKLRGQLELF